MRAARSASRAAARLVRAEQLIRRVLGPVEGAGRQVDPSVRRLRQAVREDLLRRILEGRLPPVAAARAVLALRVEKGADRAVALDVPRIVELARARRVHNRGGVAATEEPWAIRP